MRRRSGIQGTPSPESTRETYCAAHAHLLEDDALGVRAAGERLLPLGAKVGLLEVLVGPALSAGVRQQLATSANTTGLTARGNDESHRTVSYIDRQTRLPEFT